MSQTIPECLSYGKWMPFPLLGGEGHPFISALVSLRAECLMAFIHSFADVNYR
jgi:hypothetical protein